MMLDVGLSGQLIREGPCLFLLRNGVTYGLAWPEGRTSWNAERNAIVINGEQTRIDGRVDVGAEVIELPGDAQTFAVRPLPECVGEKYALVSGFASDVTE
jgi:hypothetical protein